MKFYMPRNHGFPDKAGSVFIITERQEGLVKLKRYNGTRVKTYTENSFQRLYKTHPVFKTVEHIEAYLKWSDVR